ncbi:hypothetical protein BDR26DRAFT_875300 [Obelidium mucronatum]|nr:hypothetical protein BDR26DRAFT_875300 [Obelidium mucronatum]
MSQLYFKENPLNPIAFGCVVLAAFVVRTSAIRPNLSLLCRIYLAPVILFLKYFKL